MVSTLHKLRKTKDTTCFKRFNHLVHGNSFDFAAHAHHPPASPIGTLLDFNCTLLARSIRNTVGVMNFSPCLNCLRARHCNHPSLTLSLVRRFHPLIISSVILSTVGHGTLAPSSFSDRPLDRTISLASRNHHGFLELCRRGGRSGFGRPILNHRYACRRTFRVRTQLLTGCLVTRASRCPPLILGWGK